MATKQQEIDDPHSTWNKIGPDEPIFILRAQDTIAPGTVRDWARGAKMRGASVAKVHEAEALADAMEEWPKRKDPD